MTKVMAKLDNQFAKVVSVLEGLEERVAKVESMAAPVKVSKSYLVDKSVVSESSTIAKQEARLKELEKIRDADLARYQRENMQKEAFEVLDQIKELKKLDERG
jgi:isoaspartyl peptidase/L-asparaginase-like protein (Ntn-hydrolase superfamily)